MKPEADDYRPCYMDFYDSGELLARRDAALESLGCCRLCPRSCGVNRTAGEYRSALSAAAAAGLSRLDRRDRPPLLFRFF